MTTPTHETVTGPQTGQPDMDALACQSETLRAEVARAEPGAIIVDVYDWVGLDEIVGAFRALIAQAKFWPRGAIYAADVTTRTVLEIEHHARVCEPMATAREAVRRSCAKHQLRPT